METLENLKKTLNTSKSVKQVVSTMKALSASNIKKYEKIAKILFAYKNNIELAIQAVLMNNDKINLNDIKYFKKSGNTNLIIACGSNQGLCGRFNDKIKDFVLEDVKKNSQNTEIIVIGEKLSTLLSIEKVKIIKTIYLPNYIEMSSNTIYDIIQIIEDKIINNKINNIYIYYTANDNSTNGTLTKVRLIPVDKKIIENIKNRTWPTSNLPFWQTEDYVILSDLLKQYISVSINNALANSMASEQKNRLITLQNAENNINILEIDEYIDILSEKLQAIINETLVEYGLIMPEFYITSVLTPDDDPNFRRLKQQFAEKTLRVREEEIKKADDSKTLLESFKKYNKQDLIYQKTKKLLSFNLMLLKTKQKISLLLKLRMKIKYLYTPL